MIRTAVVDVQRGVGDLDLACADHWHVLLKRGDLPVERVELPSSGATPGSALAEAALLRRADARVAREELVERLRSRLGDAAPATPELRISVVVCTHRRTHYLPELLDALLRLEPAPFEVIVVDNDPGDADCRAAVEQASFCYVREDRRGLDNARNAGVRAARGDVVAFTDDDCVPSVRWLAPVGRAFAHPGVAAVTGPAFPHVLDTPARVRMERQASLARGLWRFAFDWRTMSPLHAAAIGVGANMAFKRERLLALGPEPFAPELDAGTETESGGDTYLLSRLLAAGERVVYEPEMHVFHRHRPDGAALHRAVLGYGIGLSAALTKAIVEERELSAPRAWAWLVKQYLQTQGRRAIGRADAVETRISWDYLRGGFLGAGRWRRARRRQRAPALPRPPARDPGRVHPPAAAAGQVRSETRESGTLALSVIVPTYRRPDALARCLDALAAQDVAPARFEVIVVDDDDAGGDVRAALVSDRYPFALHHVRSGGLGAAGARNCGARAAAAELLLFLDDDVVADPWLVRRHLEWHAARDGRAALVGPYRPHPTRENLAAVVARMWWQDMFQLLEEARGTTFVAALTANVSLPRALFEAVGGFSEDFARQRREDWEWGLRLLRAGAAIGYDPHASARHEFTLGTAQRLRDARREGFGDTLLVARFPEALPSLPLLAHRPPAIGQPLRWLGFRLWRLGSTQRAVVGLLELLERARLRGLWSRLFRLAQSAAYAHGAHEGGWTARAPERAAARPYAVAIELVSDVPIPVPDVAAPLVRVTVRGAEVARVAPLEGIWGPGLAEQIADALGPGDLALAAALGGWIPDAPECGDRAADVEVVFGPANLPSDLAGGPALEALGARVTVAPGEVNRHWVAVAAAARAAERPFVAMPLPGTAPGPAWLAEALVAFDGERVGLALGGGLGRAHQCEPLYLHDARTGDASLLLTTDPAAYVVVRRELAELLAPAGPDLLAPMMVAVERALADGWIVAHRHVRGLGRPAYSARERGEAYGRHQALPLARGGSARRIEGVLALATRGALVLAWRVMRQRGRLTREQRELAVGIARGASHALLREPS
jgi:glycosyltransferase involved in cell wall biosynthesis